MGCGTSSKQEKLIDMEITSTFEHLNIHNLDEKFHKLSHFVSTVEKFRKAISEKRDELLLKTGACVLKNPTLFKIFLAGLWKIAADYKGVFDLSGMQVLKKSPFISLTCKEITIESLMIFFEIKNYISSLYCLKDDFLSCCSKINELRDSFEKEMKINSSMYIDNKQLDYNINKVNNIHSLSNDLKIMLSDSLNQIEYFIDFLKDNVKRKTISEKGFVAFKKSLTDVCEICWNLTEDEKYEECFQGKELILKKIELRKKS